MGDLLSDLSAAGLRVVHGDGPAGLQVWADVRLGNGDIEPAGYAVDVGGRRIRRLLDYDGWLAPDLFTAAGVVATIVAHEHAWRRRAWPAQPDLWPADA